MSLWGEIEYEDKDDLWVGENDELRIEIAQETWYEAGHIMAMRGLSRPVWMQMLHDMDIWLNDNTLRALEGVEVTPLEQR